MIIFPSVKRAMQRGLISFSNVSMLSFFVIFIHCASAVSVTNVHFNVGEPTGTVRAGLSDPKPARDEISLSAIIIRRINGSHSGGLERDTDLRFIILINKGHFYGGSNLLITRGSSFIASIVLFTLVYFSIMKTISCASNSSGLMLVRVMVEYFKDLYIISRIQGC